MPVVAAAPLIGTGIGLLGKLFGGGGSSAAAQSQTGTAPALAASQSATGALGSQGSSLFGTGQAATGQAANYYSSLLGGGRAGITAAVAPEIAATNDVYSGAQRGLQRSNLQGAQKDMASANLATSNAGKISSLLQSVRPGAASALANIGSTASGQGVNATQGAGGLSNSLLSGLTGQGSLALAQQKQANDQSSALWTGLGNLFGNSFNAFKNNGGGTGGQSPNLSIQGG